MEWFRIKTSSLLVRVAVDEIVYVKADGNYCDLVLINGRSRKMTFQLHHFEDNFKLLKSADMFIRVGRSLIVNRQYVQVIDLIDQVIIFGGKHLTLEPKTDISHTYRPDRGDEVGAGTTMTRTCSAELWTGASSTASPRPRSISSRHILVLVCSNRWNVTDE